jgi:hypothetical protein
MYRTPPRAVMVKTRSTVRKEREQLQTEDSTSKFQEPGPSQQYQTPKMSSVKSEPRLFAAPTCAPLPGAIKPLSAPPPLRAATTSKSKRSTTSSVLAKRKRLELEAEKKKAEIRMHLIDKELEIDLADLEEEDKYSSQASEDCTRRDVEKWIEHSAQELERPQAAPENGIDTGDLRQPAAPAAGSSDGTVQLLAAAVKNLTVASIHNKSNANFLSRVCTPRDLPEYSGDPLEWLHFKQAYQESTDVCNFSPKENLWRLRKCLRGAAKETVSALLMSAASPERIMATLELRHGDPECIINRLLHDIRKLQPLSSEYQKDIVNFSIKVQNFVESVKVVGREEYIQGLSIVPLLISKLPTVLVSKWSDYSYPLIQAGTRSRLSIMSEFLNMEAVKIATTANVYLQSYRSDQQRSKQQDNYIRPQPVLLQTERQNSWKSDKCHFCRAQQGHKLPECKQFKRALRKVRWQYVKRNGICFKCLESRHEREICTAPVCDKDDCGGAHHRLLHFNNNNGQLVSADEPGERAARSADVPSPEIVSYVGTGSNRVLLKVVPIRIRATNGSVIDSSAILDDGSSVTVISAELAARAGLSGRRESMHVCGPWNKSDIVCDTMVVNIELCDKDNKVHSIKARSVNELCLPYQNLSAIDCSKYPYLNRIQSELSNVVSKPEMLIGQDNYNLMVPLEIILGKPNEPVATFSPLGWCIHGVVRVSGSTRGASTGGAHAALLVGAAPAPARGASEQRALRDLHDEVRRAFELDSMGVSGKPRQNRDDVQAVEHLERTAHLVEGRWRVGLPWKNPDCLMPDTFPSALKRLKGIERKMAKDSAYAERYAERVKHLFTNNFARELEDTQRTPRTWYLSHFGVDNPNKKKLRLVYDAADQVEGVCLNDHLLKGPDLLTSLWGIMLRFRENRIGVSGDIKDMFLRIQIQPQDQDALRFLWRDDPTEPVKTYVMTSLIFGAKCSPFVAQFIKNKNAQRYEHTEPAAVDAICNSHYADDYIQSLPDESTAIKMVTTVARIHAEGGFEIRNWTSNSTLVLDSVPNETLGTAAVRFKIDQQFEGERTLGLIWYPATDELGFDLSLKRIPEQIVLGHQKPTKRIMLKVVMSIFDVFGFLAPFTIQGRIMLRDTWKSSINWDEDIPDDIFMKWIKWLDLLQLISHIRIPRWYYKASIGASRMEREPAAEAYTCATTATPTATPCYEPVSATKTDATDVSDIHCYNYNNLQLHLFCDASTKAMCAVAYWRWENNGQIYVAFVASKCKVAPVKTITVNKLELQAALLAARLADSVQREHKMTTGQRYYWCDSTTVLHWIRNDARNYNIFIANRLGEIDELSRANEWRYIPTKLNVADVGTREVYDETIFKGEWINGPEFLHGDESQWPSDIVNPEVSEIALECIHLVQNEKCDLPVPDAARFSSWLRLLRSTAAVLKFVDKCRRRSADIDCTMMERAERLLIKQTQQELFRDDIADMRKGNVLNRSSKLSKLSPYLDEHGLLRCSGRIDAALNVAPETKRPIILDGKHAVARLLVRSYHEKAAHGNHEGVVNDLKQKYWLFKLRPTVKAVVAHCMYCRIRKAKPEVPRMGNLPEARLAHHQRPFTHCGLDLFGPMEVIVGRRHEHRYGVLFTCLTLRAIHLELVHSLTSDSLIMALRRMAARRGWPKYLYSDNGTNLRGANTELTRCLQELDEEDLKNKGVNFGVQWTFIPPASPHWGGAWERLIRSVKTSLKVILKERVPKDEVLSTLMTEVENMVNGRPLTHVSVEPNSEETLTPNHFLIMGAASHLPAAGAFDDSDLYSRKQWRKSQRLADMYWTRWVKEILPDLIPRTKWTQEQNPLQVGDFVFIVDPAAQRNVWLKGVIQRVFPGRDGRVRVVEVKTKTGTLRRSASRVARIPMNVEC